MLIDSQRVSANFSSAANSYDQHAALQRKIAQQLRQQWPALPRSATVVDLGCGTGADSEWLCQQHNLHIVDIAAEMLRHTQQRCPRAVVAHQCSDQALSQLGLKADAIWSSSMLQWSTDMNRSAAQLYQTLKPGGYLLGSLFTQGSLGELKQAWSKVDQAPHILELPSIEDTQAAFESAGFKIHWQSRISQPLFFPNLKAIHQHLRGLGAVNALQNRPKGLMGKRQLQWLSEALEHYRQPEGIALSWNAWLFKAEKSR